MDLDVTALVEAYKAGTSAAALARQCQASVWSILDRLRKAGVTIRSNKEQNEKRLNLSKTQTPAFVGIVDGLLLGDGSIDPKGCLRLEQAKIRLGWLKEVAVRFSTVKVDSRIIPILPRECSIGVRKIRFKGGGLLYTPTYVEMQQHRLRWYPKGIKRVPADVSLDPIAVAYWFCGDGSCSSNGTLVFCTNGFRKNEVRLLATRLSTAVGIEARCVPVSPYVRPGEFIVIVSNRNDAQLLKEFIEPHVPECCRYKLRFVRAAIPRSAWAKLSAQQAAEVRSRYANGEKQTSLAVEFGVTPSAISNIVRYKAHRGSQGPSTKGTFA
jgi:LAGLIDADG DNA endonuclease family protein